MNTSKQIHEQYKLIRGKAWLKSAVFHLYTGFSSFFLHSFHLYTKTQHAQVKHILLIMRHLKKNESTRSINYNFQCLSVIILEHQENLWYSCLATIPLGGMFKFAILIFNYERAHFKKNINCKFKLKTIIYFLYI